GFDHDAGVFGESNLLAASDPAAVEGARRAPIADACSGVRRTSSESDDRPNEAKPGSAACTILAKLIAIAATVVVLVERSARHQGEDERNADLVSRFGFRLSFRVQCDVLCRVSARQPSLYCLGVAVRQSELTEAEAECARTAKHARRLCAGHSADESSSLGNSQRVVGIVDRLRDDGLDSLTGL